ncbi:hypothetical protein M406DRAFT_217196, partial [Cryphonectria parasitica EP155]
RRRRRPTTACVVCRRRKTRCNGEHPCSNCSRARKKEACVYEDETPQRSAPEGPSPASQDGSPVPSSSIKTPSIVGANPKSGGPDVDALKTRIRHLEEELGRINNSRTAPPVACATTATTPVSHVGTPSSHTFESKIGGTFHIHHPTSREPAHKSTIEQAHGISRSISHKTRLFGQSHWVNTVAAIAQDLITLVDPYLGTENSNILSGIQKCKCIARVIKAQRAPQWPCPPRPGLPPKHLADELLEHYLQTFETVYRVLHVPTFKRDYESLWVSDDTSQPNIAFIVQLKLVFALGALIYDDRFTLRTLAIQWIYEAQTYLSEPIFKSRLGIQTLQTRILLVLAQEFVDVGGDATWVSVGVIMRTAIIMGLHRDPSQLPEMSTFQAEMRRRLWNTILELSLQASMQTGGPPLISTNDFDTGPPCNYDDEVLLVEDAAPKRGDEPTDTSVARALRQTYPARLAVAKSLNDLSSEPSSYEETLRLDAELRKAFKTMSQALQQRTSREPRPDFAAKVVDFLVLWYLSSLHAPYFAASLHETSYAFSRKVMVDLSLRMWCAVCPSSAITATSLSSREDDVTPQEGGDWFSRFVTCGAGFFRSGGFRAGFITTAELRAQLQEDDNLGLGLGLGSLNTRTDLFAIVGETKAWCLQCIDTGETNIKGHLISSLLAAHIEGLKRGVPKEDLGRFLVRAADEAVEICLPIIEA